MTINEEQLAAAIARAELAESRLEQVRTRALNLTAGDTVQTVATDVHAIVTSGTPDYAELFRLEGIAEARAAVDLVRHHHRPSDFGSGWWNSMVNDALEQIDGITEWKQKDLAETAELRDAVDGG